MTIELRVRLCNIENKIMLGKYEIAPNFGQDVIQKKKEKNY